MPCAEKTSLVKWIEPTSKRVSQASSTARYRKKLTSPARNAGAVFALGAIDAVEALLGVGHAGADVLLRRVHRDACDC